MAANTLQARLVTQLAPTSAPGRPMATSVTHRAEAVPAAAQAPAALSGRRRDQHGELPTVSPTAQPMTDSATQTALAAAPAYHAAKGLDPPPHPVQPIDPVYPESAGLQEGSVVLRVLISASGEVDDVAVVRANPAGLFESSALLAFRQARFTPGYFLGIPVKSLIYVEVGYTPINRGGAVSGQSH